MSGSVEDFIAAMRAAGVDPKEPIASKLMGGKVVRFRCEGDGRKRNGWAVFFPADGQGGRAGGSFGNYKQNTGSITWQAERQGPVLSPAERARLRRQWQEEAERKARATEQAQIAARAEALRLWDSAAPARADHPYAAKKRMRVGGLRQDGDVLLVPMRDPAGDIWNLQRIWPDGAKRFMKDARVTGLCARIGMRAEFRRGVFAEGFATGEAISQALGGDRPVIVAFNTANLAPVVGEWTRAHALADWTIAADDDHLTGLKMVERGQPYQNPGVEKAQAVAAEFGCRVALPVRREAASSSAAVGDNAARNTDFSDLFLEGRLGEIVAAFDGARRSVGAPSLAERVGMMVGVR